MKKLLLLRPEPCLSASVNRARAMGLEVVPCPLFRIEPVEWAVPDPADYDALLLTSANAVRHGGTGLLSFKTLPVHAVGAATAAAAQEAGLWVETFGTGDVVDLMASLPASLNLLHLAGEDRREIASGHRVDVRIVYRSAPIEVPGLPPLDGLVVAVHSPRAGTRLADLADNRGGTSIATISKATAEACGNGWQRLLVADRPNDPSLLALAAMLCHTPPPE